MTRRCPKCAWTGPAFRFARLDQPDRPARHDAYRRVCPKCGHRAAAWTFVRSPHKESA